MLATLLAVMAALHAPKSARAVENNADVRVVVTTKPVHSLVAQLMAGVAEPYLLVDGSASSHTFALKPSAAKAIASSGVFVRVSEAVEPFTRKLAQELPANVSMLTLVDAKLGMKLLKQRSSAAFEPHEHGADDDHQHNHGRQPEHQAHDDEGDLANLEGAHASPHDAADHGPHVANAAGALDGHIWLDPENAKSIVRAVLKTLSAKWPQHRAVFSANAERATARIDALEAETIREVSALKGKSFVVFHDAYQYFEARFDMPAAGAITVSPDQPPSAQRLTKIREKIRALAAQCVFAEPGFQPNLLAAVTEGLNARSASLDPEGQALPAGPELYEALMRGLVRDLKACLLKN